jgi:hypothetical protein
MISKQLSYIYFNVRDILLSNNNRIRSDEAKREKMLNDVEFFVRALHRGKGSEGAAPA